MHALDQIGTVESESKIAVRSELLLLAFHQRIGSVEHEAGWSVGARRQPLPGDGVEIPFGRGVHHFRFAPRRDATMADAAAEQPGCRMPVVNDAVMSLAP